MSSLQFTSIYISTKSIKKWNLFLTIPYISNLAMFLLKCDLNGFWKLHGEKKFQDSFSVDLSKYKCQFDFAIDQSNCTELV